jgi:adenosylcobinamide-GDP ribazoletransferase
MIRPFLIALQFLTRLPVRLKTPPEPSEMSYSVLYYPAVGLILGLLLATLAWPLGQLPVLLAAALLLAAWVLVTGALHLDGLADTADAWAGGRGDRERTLAIMKDPRSGPMGVTAVVLVLMVKLAALFTLFEGGEFLALVLTPLLGRAGLPLLFLTTPYVRAGGLGARLVSQLPRRRAAGIIAVSYAIVPIAAGAVGIWAVISAIATFFCLRALMCQRISGTTGDTAGALVEITEVSVLISIAITLSLR